ncbi:MAG: hypothetical protein ACMUHY_07120, partial [Thermoplasmatota archaeon]
AAIQPGLVNVEGREELHARGGRSQEVTYYIDGVKVVSGDGFGSNGMVIPHWSHPDKNCLGCMVLDIVRDEEESFTL